MALCALSDVKTMLNITTTDMDAKLTLIISRVSANIASYLGYNPEFGTYTEEVHAVTNRQLIQLTAMPIQSVASVTNKGVAVTTYKILPEYARWGMLYLGTGWTGRYYTRGMTYDPVAGFYDILVSYTAGWYTPTDAQYVEGASNSLPYAIVGACIDEAVALYRRNNRNAEGLKAHTEGGISDTYLAADEYAVYANGLSKATCDALAPYRYVGVA